jgi:hypothetical protein
VLLRRRLASSYFALIRVRPYRTVQHDESWEVRDMSTTQGQGECVPVVPFLVRFAETSQCDEQYPTCGQCTKRSRPCYYTPSKIRKMHVTLVKRPSGGVDHADNPPEDAGGKALVPYSRSRTVARDQKAAYFESMGASSTLCVPLDKRFPNERYHSAPPQLWPHVNRPEDLLRARFVGLVEPSPVSQNPSILWGKWLMLVAPRVGQSSALDDATLCVVHAIMVRHSRTDENVKAVQRTYGRALSSLRTAIGSSNEDIAFSNETIAATRLLTAAEVTCLIVNIGRY